MRPGGVFGEERVRRATPIAPAICVASAWVAAALALARTGWCDAPPAAKEQAVGSVGREISVDTARVELNHCRILCGKSSSWVLHNHQNVERTHVTSTVFFSRGLRRFVLLARRLRGRQG